MALVMATAMPLQAFAAEYDLAEGSVTIHATETDQTVTHGDKAPVPDSAPVITQADSLNSTSNTIIITSEGNAVAEVTIKDVYISCEEDAIDVGSANAVITVEGDNLLVTEYGGAIHVSDGNLTITGDGVLAIELEDYAYHAEIGSHDEEEMSGSIHITGDVTVNMQNDGDDDYVGGGAGIGSGDEAEMSGTILIDGNAKVNAYSMEDGAGIGSGSEGDMSGTITIGGNAEVVAGSGWEGAGIGAGDEAEMSGTITIGDHAKVTAWSEDEGAGIGSGQDSHVSGSIIIGGNSQVTAAADDDGAGIGSGQNGNLTEGSVIDIKDNATVIAAGYDDAAAIGGGSNGEMAGTIVIRGNSDVTAIAGDCAAAIGTDDSNDMTGTIMILENAKVTTGVEDGVSFDYEAKTVEYDLDDYTGYIGDGDDGDHDSENGHYVIGPNVTINGVSGSDVEGLMEYVNVRLEYSEAGAVPQNLTTLDIQNQDGVVTVSATGEATAKVLYNGSETVPADPSKAQVTVKLTYGDGTSTAFTYKEAKANQPETKGHVHYYGDWADNGNGTHSAHCKRCSHVKTVNCTQYSVTIDGTEYKVCPVCGHSDAGLFAVVEGATITGKKLPRGEALVRGAEAPFEGVLYAFTAGYECGGKMEHFQKPVTISLPLPLTTDSFKLVAAEGDDWDELDYTFENGLLTFTAEEEGLFLILPVEAE